MASISIVGKVVGKQGQAPVALKEFDNGNKIASFSVVDNEYFYSPEGSERVGQFYTVQVNGKAAEIFADRLQRGDRVGVHGQIVQRTYQDKTYLDVRNARVTHLEPRPEQDAPARSGNDNRTASKTTGGRNSHDYDSLPF